MIFYKTHKTDLVNKWKKPRSKYFYPKITTLNNKKAFLANKFKIFTKHMVISLRSSLLANQAKVFKLKNKYKWQISYIKGHFVRK